MRWNTVSWRECGIQGGRFQTRRTDPNEANLRRVDQREIDLANVVGQVTDGGDPGAERLHGSLCLALTLRTLNLDESKPFQKFVRCGQL